MPALAKASGLEVKQLFAIRGLQVMRAGFDGHIYHYSELPLELPGAGQAQKCSPPASITLYL